MNLSELFPKTDIELYEKFCITPSKFIYFNSGRGGHNFPFEKWETVFKLVKLNLAEPLKIIQVGSKKHKLLAEAIDCRGASIGNRVFLLKKCLFAVSFGGFEAHYGKCPVAAIYGFFRGEQFGPNNYLNLTSKQWRTFEDAKKEIEDFNPLTIANFILRTSNLHSSEFFSYGKAMPLYSEPIIDVIPNFMPTKNFAGMTLNLHLNQNPQTKTFVESWLHGRQISIITGERLNLDFLFKIRKIMPLICFTNPDKIEEDYISLILSKGIGCDILSSKKDLSKNKNTFFDANVFSYDEPKIDADISHALISRIYFSKGKFYISENHALKDEKGWPAEHFSSHFFNQAVKIDKNDLTLAGKDINYWYLLKK